MGRDGNHPDLARGPSRAIAKLISRDQVELGSISATEVVWGIFPSANAAMIVLMKFFHPAHSGAATILADQIMRAAVHFPTGEADITGTCNSVLARLGAHSSSRLPTDHHKSTAALATLIFDLGEPDPVAKHPSVQRRWYGLHEAAQTLLLAAASNPSSRFVAADFDELLEPLQAIADDIAAANSRREAAHALRGSERVNSAFAILPTAPGLWGSPVQTAAVRAAHARPPTALKP